METPMPSSAGFAVSAPTAIRAAPPTIVTSSFTVLLIRPSCSNSPGPLPAVQAHQRQAFVGSARCKTAVGAHHADRALGRAVVDEHDVTAAREGDRNFRAAEFRGEVGDEGLEARAVDLRGTGFVGIFAAVIRREIGSTDGHGANAVAHMKAAVEGAELKRHLGGALDHAVQTIGPVRKTLKGHVECG